MKTRFKLVVTPKGEALLTTADDLTQAELARLRDLIRDWKKRGSLGVIASCEVVEVRDIAFDLGPRTDA